MEKILKINCPKGKDVIYDEDTMSIRFIDIEPVQSESWDEFCKNHPNTKGEYVVHPGSIMKAETMDLRKSGWFSIFETKEDAEGIVAFMKLIRLHDEWVEGYSRKNAVVAIYYECDIDEICVASAWNTLWFPDFYSADKFIDCHRDLIMKAKRFI